MTTLPITLPAGLPVARSGVRDRLSLAIACALALSSLASVVLLTATGMTVAPAGFMRFAVLAAIMAGLAWWCRARGLDPRLGAAAGIVGVGTVSLLLCAVVSNVGLRLGAPLADARLAAADATVGIDVAGVIRSVAALPLLSDVLATIYNTSQIVVAALIGLAVVRRHVGKAWELTATAVISMQLVAIVSPSVPAWGAMRQFALEGLQGQGLPVGAGVYQWPAFAHFYVGNDPLLRLTDLGGVVAFPSFHTVLALMITQALADTRLRWLGIGWTAAIVLSAIPMGGHYAVDLAGGFIIWLAAVTIVRRASANTPSA